MISHTHTQQQQQQQDLFWWRCQQSMDAKQAIAGTEKGRGKQERRQQTQRLRVQAEKLMIVMMLESNAKGMQLVFW